MTGDGLDSIAVAGEEELDLTNSHLPSLEDVELDANLRVRARLMMLPPARDRRGCRPAPAPAAPTRAPFARAQALDLTANRLHHLEPKLRALTGLTRLCLRQNLVSDPAEVEALASAAALRHLELRDNQLPAAPHLRAFTSLRYLELSYNEIRSLEPLAELAAPGLEELYAAANKVTAIQGLSQLTSLTLLELGSNRVRAIEGLESLALLRELWLGRNRIAEAANLAALTALRRLSLQSNRLTSVRGLEACTALEELYVSHNGIDSLEVGGRAACRRACAV
jgi:protein phosphatase 1 regulatory subunit 7